MIRQGCGVSSRATAASLWGVMLLGPALLGPTLIGRAAIGQAAIGQVAAAQDRGDASGAPAPAQQAPGAQQALAPGQGGPSASSGPALRTARLSFLAGSVSVVRADNTGEDTPVLNMPLYAGTRIVTGDYGEAEIEFEDGSVARLVPRSTLALDRLALPEGGVVRTELSVAGGLVYFELRSSAAGVFRIAAAGTVATPIENTIVRVRLDDPPAVFSVLGGAARLERVEAGQGDGSQDRFRTEVHAGESLTADATDASRYFLSRDVASETWDRWNDERDRAADDDASRRTVARDGYAGEQGYGWGDLDANGSWYDVPGQGSLWQPNAADASFDPYGYGAWVWGNGAYLYASGYSWGWTPYRCGRWLWLPGFGWGWQPDAGCARFGFGGFDGGGFAVAAGPPRYRPIKRPVPGPGGVHPIVIAHGPDGARPPVHLGGPVKIAGVLVRPLPPIGSAMRAGSGLPGASSTVLARDFPLDPGSGKPLLGIGASSPGGERRETPVARLPASGAAGAPHHAPAAGASSSARGASPGVAALPSTLPPPPPPIPVAPPPPLRIAPMPPPPPPPAPVYHAPAYSPPAAPAPAPSPRGDTAPKGK